MGLAAVDSETTIVVTESGAVAAVVEVDEITGVVGAGLVAEAGAVAVSSIAAGEPCSGSGTAQAGTNSIKLSKVKRTAKGPRCSGQLLGHLPSL